MELPRAPMLVREDKKSKKESGTLITRIPNFVKMLSKGIPYNYEPKNSSSLKDD